ncbi:carbonic anhydrase [Paenibacillus sp. IB182496]|uniref:carbonic anhydrase n=1 Tax=Paenibacillus sabuli TaxID=2772509 RepID=A0A927BVW0_9BACL|nr:carbonic anhydrase [Paenibacillus sabuli]MBD2846861.1 carbonic anhydrase [Paenibacillus sabuli]
MSILRDIMAFNQSFVEEKQYEQYVTDKFPGKRAVILTCMDTRLVELLPKALNLRNGDVKIVKNAGAILTQPFGSAMRSILVAIYALGAREVFVIGHHGCGMTKLDSDAMVEKFKEEGIEASVIDTLEQSGISMKRFLRGFDSPEDGVKHSVDIIRNHPLLPRNIPVHGLVIDPTTGALDLIDEDTRPIEAEQ